MVSRYRFLGTHKWFKSHILLIVKIAQLLNVSHSFSGQLAINNISLGFEEKKVTAIIGRSGSGKSTLLQFINGLIKPSAGTISVFCEGMNYQEISATRLRMGYMVQGTGLFPHLTIAENISIAARISSYPSDVNQRVRELMTLVGLPDSFQGKYPFELSGGEQQRVGICRALFLDPPILLMDEALGALDPITRQEIQSEILKLQKIEPRTILLVTHDMREAKILADYILVIDKGEVQQYDTKEKVLQSPANTVVEKIIEASVW
jgi:osmoprotectant transport system ATP-binding protein